MFNLFALTDDPGRRRLRFSLSAEVQKELTACLQGQEASFIVQGAEEIQFDGNYKPEADEVLFIPDYDDIDDLSSAIENPLSVPEVVASPDVFDGIKALFSGYVDANGDVVVLIQYFEKRRVISPAGLSLFHSGNVYKKIDGIGLTVDSKLAATLSGGVLRFHSFHLLKRIFDVSAYYKEATDVDIRQFASMPCVSVENTDDLIAVSDTWVRRKLWLISQSGILAQVPVADIKAVAAEFQIELETEVVDGVERFVIPADKKQLKKVLRLLDEDYYKSPLSENCYLANSKRPAV